jgi:hypothetical protein
MKTTRERQFSFAATYRVDDEVPGSAASRVFAVDRQGDLPQVLRHVTIATRFVEIAEQDVAEASHCVDQACQKSLGSVSVDSPTK